VKLALPIAGLLALPLLCLGLAAPPRSQAAETPAVRHISGAPIRSFREVIPGCIYSSGQPAGPGFHWLREHGFRSVVCLRREQDDGAATMEQMGFHYLYLPIVDNHAPTIEQASAFLKFASSPDNWPLIVHCREGLGRAATMCTLVRYSFQGESLSEALAETRYTVFHGLVHRKLHGPQRHFLEAWAGSHTAGEMRPRVALGSASR
jgi:protein tyrosine phosphatase (PTP) superfamily phosphohydrolase (DUF442 family)